MLLSFHLLIFSPEYLKNLSPGFPEAEPLGSQNTAGEHLSL